MLCKWCGARIANTTVRTAILSWMEYTKGVPFAGSGIRDLGTARVGKGTTMRDIDEPIRIRCENCVYYGKECHGEYCVLIEMLSGERKEDGND